MKPKHPSAFALAYDSILAAIKAGNSEPSPPPAPILNTPDITPEIKRAAPLGNPQPNVKTRPRSMLKAITTLFKKGSAEQQRHHFTDFLDPPPGETWTTQRTAGGVVVSGTDANTGRIEIKLQAFDAQTFTKTRHLGATEATLGDPPPNVRKAASAPFDVLADYFANGEGKPNPPGLFRDTTFKPPRGDLRVGLRPELPAGTWMDQHPDDLAVDRFAAAMKAKLAASRAKGRSGWNNTNDPTDLQLAEALVEHMTKGNAGTFEDVANFCMFLQQRGASPGILQHAALYTPATNFQRNTLLDALREVREALQFANKSPDGPIRDTIWMMHRPETLFDFIDATLEGLFPEVTSTAFAGGRNMLYAGLFEDETEEERDARLALAHAMRQDTKGED